MYPGDEPRRVGSLRLAAAIGVATAAACATSLLSGFAFLFVTSLGSSDGWMSIQQFVGGSLAIGVIAAAFAVVICPTLFVIVGLPLYALSIAKEWVSLPAYTFAGFATSVTATLLIPSHFTALFLLTGGTAATVAFWLVVRPDQSQAGD